VRIRHKKTYTINVGYPIFILFKKRMFWIIFKLGVYLQLATINIILIRVSTVIEIEKHYIMLVIQFLFYFKKKKFWIVFKLGVYLQLATINIILTRVSTIIEI
jgi:predicted nucleotidyltransferase